MGQRKRKNESGQGLVEFALVLPVLLLVLLSILEGGLLLFNQHVITNASREGARYGIVARVSRRSGAEITNVVNAYTADHLITFGEGVPVTTVTTNTSSGSPSDAVFGDNLTVQVAFRYDFLVLPNFVGQLTGATDLLATAMMKYE
jgi:Flp pilus assembly protein TadG